MASLSTTRMVGVNYYPEHFQPSLPIQPQPKVIENLPSNHAFDLQRFRTDSLLCHDVCIPETSTLEVAAESNKDISNMNLDLAVELEENGADKEENELFVRPSPLDVYAHKIFDEMPVNEIGEPFNESISPEMKEIKEMVQKLALQMTSLSSRQNRQAQRFSSQLSEIKDSWKTKRNLDDHTYIVMEEVKKKEIEQRNCPLTSEKLDTLVAMVNNNDSSHIIHAPTVAETTTGGVFDVRFGEDIGDHKLDVARRVPMVEEYLSTIGTGAEEIDVRKHKEVEPIVTLVVSQNILMRKDELMVVEEETVKLETDMGTDLADICEEPAETKNDVDGNTYFTGQEMEKYVEESSSHLIEERSGAINMVLSDNVSSHIIHTPAVVFITLGAEKNHHAMRDPITTSKKYTSENNLTSEVELKSIDKKIDKLIGEVVEFADATPVPNCSQLLEHVIADPRSCKIGPDPKLRDAQCSLMVNCAVCKTGATSKSVQHVAYRLRYELITNAFTSRVRKKWDRSGDDHGIGCVSMVNKGHGRCGVSYRDKLENDDCKVDLVDSPNHHQRAVNLVVGEQPVDVYTGTSLCVHHVIRGDSTKDHAADSNALLVKLLTNQVENILVKQTVASSVYKVASTGRCEQFKSKGEEKGLINDDMLLFSASCYAAKFSLGAFYSFIQVDSLSTMVSRSCVLNSSVQSQFLYNVSYEVCMVILLATYYSKIIVIMDYLKAMVGENLHKEYEVLDVQFNKRPFTSSYLNERLMTMKERSDDIHSLKKIKMIFPVCLLYIGMRREGSLGRHFYVAKLPLIFNFLCVVWGYKHENSWLTAVKAVKNLIHEYCVGDIKWNNFNVQLIHSGVQANVEERVLMVGKRLVFDNSGYNIEGGPDCFLELMKFDMRVTAIVLDAAKAFEQMQTTGVEVHFIAIACENMKFQFLGLHHRQKHQLTVVLINTKVIGNVAELFHDNDTEITVDNASTKKLRLLLLLLKLTCQNYEKSCIPFGIETLLKGNNTQVCQLATIVHSLQVVLFEGLLWSIEAKFQSLPISFDSSKFPFDSGGITTLKDKGVVYGPVLIRYGNGSAMGSSTLCFRKCTWELA
ncbi:dna-directed rna polymerase 3b, chloroplastic [Nicotiana attenuata]|uniref:DNA-directed RNA polymerase n=1 Tax=Nicotiana attenuata TaxID=49451 RepID=A0A314KPJ5_NICAT|nr:dna-directed rna polymerase 3b, chloroplastic [Nicotiana attenuata]